MGWYYTPVINVNLNSEHTSQSGRRVSKFLKMAKNTSSSAFRKIDVDQYCEDNFKEDEVDQGGPRGPDPNEVESLLNKYPFINSHDN